MSKFLLATLFANARRVDVSKFEGESNRKTLDNNGINQVVSSSGFSENKGLGVVKVSRADTTWSTHHCYLRIFNRNI